MNCRTPLVSNTFGTNVVSTFAYAYDELSRRTQRLDTTDSALTTNTFSYNVRSELIDATMGTNTYSYAYDPIGNRQQTVENGLTNHYTANALNQYTAIAPDTPALAYDPDGNMTRNGDWTYIWDAENRLVEARPATTNLGSSLVQYMYDAQSRRIARREFVWSDYLGDTTWHYVQGRAYLYDGWNLLQERKPALTPRTPHLYIPQTNLFLTGVSGPVAAAYLWGLDLSQTLQGAGGIGGLLQSRSSATNAFPICDANGNITEILDDTAPLAAHYEYDAYGNTIIQTDPLSNASPFRFSSKHYDDASKLYYYGYRFYSTGLGRWITRDPIEEWGGINTLSCVNNNLINGSDVLGADRYVTWFDIGNLGGSGGTQIHVGVAVDTWDCGDNHKWKKTGQATFDFSIDWDAGWWNYVKGVFWKGKGRIKESSGLLLERPITVKSTPSQDRKMLEMLREEALHPPFYNGVLHQCVFWSVGALQYGMQEKGTDDCCHK